MGRALGGQQVLGSTLRPHTLAPGPMWLAPFAATARWSWLAACVCFLYLLLARRVLEDFVQIITGVVTKPGTS